MNAMLESRVAARTVQATGSTANRTADLYGFTDRRLNPIFQECMMQLTS